jgi:hypothetical protein
VTGQGLRLKKQHSTGELEKRGTSASIRSTGSSASWMSTESSQSGMTAGAGSHHTDSNASFVAEVTTFFLFTPLKKKKKQKIKKLSLSAATSCASPFLAVDSCLQLISHVEAMTIKKKKKRKKH